MAPGLPYANAAQVAFPGRQVVAFVGGGGFTMLGFEFIATVKHNLPIKVVVIKNNILSQIKREQMVSLANPEHGVALQPIDFVKFAEACGGLGLRCERPEKVRGAIQSAFASSKPALVEAVVDAFEPPLPARATAKQVLHFAESLARGEPKRTRIATTIFRVKLTELFRTPRIDRPSSGCVITSSKTSRFGGRTSSSAVDRFLSVDDRAAVGVKDLARHVG
jgi:pyruvate dehydrogenase (quinone)/pyruvate oxidase